MELSGVLRPLRASDAPAVLAAFLSAPDMARQGTVTDLAEAERYVDQLLVSGGAVRAFAVTDNDELVGLVVVAIDDANRVGWFSYWMNASHRGRGWTKRAAAGVADWALRDGRLERLELGHRANNPASRRVALAAGFVQEGLERAKFLIDAERIDVLTYGRLATDPWPVGASMAMVGGEWAASEQSNDHRASTPENGRSRFCVVPAAYVYLLRNGQVLLQQRRGTGYLDGHWVAGVAGHIEAHETAAVCAVREAREELGVQIVEADLVPVTVMQRTDGTDEPREQRVDWFFSVTRWSGDPRVMEPEKCSGLAWYSLDDLPEPVPEYEREVLRSLSAGMPLHLSTSGF